MCFPGLGMTARKVLPGNAKMTGTPDSRLRLLVGERPSSDKKEAGSRLPFRGGRADEPVAACSDVLPEISRQAEWDSSWSGSQSLLLVLFPSVTTPISSCPHPDTHSDSPVPSLSTAHRFVHFRVSADTEKHRAPL